MERSGGGHRLRKFEGQRGHTYRRPDAFVCIEILQGRKKKIVKGGPFTDTTMNKS
mgnify:CR=1 FL=1